MAKKKHTIHVSYLCVLYLALFKCRREGLLSLEDDIEHPDEPSSIFSGYSQLADYPQHREFMIDTLKLLLTGDLEPPDVVLYSDTAKKAFLDGGGKDESLWDCICVTLQTSLRGAPPRIAAEFGRQAIPWKVRPSFDELEDMLKEVRAGYEKNRSPYDITRPDGLDHAVDELFARMRA